MTNSSISQSEVGDPRSTVLEEVFLDPSLQGRRANVPAGTVIFDADDSQQQSVYFIHTGQVRLYHVAPNGEDRLVEILGPGDWFSANACCSGMPPGDARAVAVASSSITEVAADKLQTALRQRPEALMELMRQLARKLQAARAESTSLIFDDCNARLIQTLLRFSGSAAASPNEGGGVVLRITHEQLAQAVGAARETVSLALTQLRERNLLRTGRNQLFFDPNVLRELRKNGRPVEPAGKAA